MVRACFDARKNLTAVELIKIMHLLLTPWRFTHPFLCVIERKPGDVPSSVACKHNFWVGSYLQWNLDCNNFTESRAISIIINSHKKDQLSIVSLLSNHI